MKAIFLLLFLFTGACFAANTYSQETSFSLELKNETVGNVINMIEKNSEFIFFYLNDVLDTNRSVSVRVKDQPVDKILDQLFEGTDITYRISDRQITVLKKRYGSQCSCCLCTSSPPNKLLTGL
ncbi:MAG: STN domain-containing protein [Tannerellaceae bacterium]|nr:STN domain-containing protein [Tannerellaceae bacterium]